MAAPTYTEVEDRMSKMQDYIDRLYKTVSWGGQTCGLLMSNPGMPVWAEITKRVKSNTTSSKAKGLWNGSSNDLPPSNWETTSYDDSGWSTAVEVTGWASPLTGTKGIAVRNYSSGSPAQDEEENLIREHFTLGNLPVQSASVTIRIEDRLLSAYINGHYLGADTDDAPDTAYNEQTFAIDPSYLNVGGDNVLALRISNSDGWGLAVSYDISVIGRVALGQFFSDDWSQRAHSIVSGQPNDPDWTDPAWLTDAHAYATSDDYVIGLDDAKDFDYTVVPAQAYRQFSTTNSETIYGLQKITQDYAIETDDHVDLYLGPTKVVTDLQTLNKDTWVSTEVTKQNNSLLTSLDYPARHAFHLGKMFYSACGDTTKAGYFDNSVTQSGLDKDIYDVLYGTLAQNYGDYYMFWEQDVYKDAYFDWAGDRMTDLFTGLASDGQYVYPHQSKVVAIEPMFREFTKHVGYARLLWAMLQLVKGRNDDTVMPDPTMAVQGIADFVQTGVIQPYVPHTNIITLAADVQGLWNYNRFSLSQTCTLTNGSAVLTGLSDTTKLFPGTAVTGSASIPSTTIKTVDSASQVTVWDNATATGSVSLVFHVAGGMPGASSEVVNPSWAGAVPGFNHDTGRGSSFATAVYLAFASVYGYGLGKTSWKLHADEAARVLCDVVWGVSPNATDKAHIEGVEITRPNHTGGTLVAWTEGSTAASAFEGAEKTLLEKYMDDGSVYEFRIPLAVPWAAGYPVVSLTNLKQKRQEPEISPTNMEGTVLAWMALRIYNAYKNNRAYPAGTWANGLGFGGGGYGYANGKVVNSSGAAISDAFVVIVDGSTSAAPSALTNYMDIVYTDSNGEWVAKFGGSGTKTIYVIKDSYKYYRQVYSFAQADQNVTFTDITMEAM